jgi:hypothetical protein
VTLGGTVSRADRCHPAWSSSRTACAPGGAARAPVPACGLLPHFAFVVGFVLRSALRHHVRPPRNTAMQAGVVGGK